MREYNVIELYLWYVEGTSTKYKFSEDDKNNPAPAGYESCLNEDSRELHLFNSESSIKLIITEGWVIVENPCVADDGSAYINVHTFPRERVLRIWFDIM